MDWISMILSNKKVWGYAVHRSSQKCNFLDILVFWSTLKLTWKCWMSIQNFTTQTLTLHMPNHIGKHENCCTSGHKSYCIFKHALYSEIHKQCWQSFWGFSLVHLVHKESLKTEIEECCVFFKNLLHLANSMAYLHH